MFFARFYELPVLETERLTLRAMTMHDLNDLYAYGRLPETTRFTLWDPHRSIDDARRFLADCAAAREEGRPQPWAVVVRSERRVIGTAGFGDFRIEHACGEVGYALHPDAWGKGYATEALRAILASGFRDFACNRIEARCVAEHTASTRVMEKAGMQYEGTLRQALFLKGSYRDIKLYSALATDDLG